MFFPVLFVSSLYFLTQLEFSLCLSILLPSSSSNFIIISLNSCWIDYLSPSCSVLFLRSCLVPLFETYSSISSLCPVLLFISVCQVGQLCLLISEKRCCVGDALQGPGVLSSRPQSWMHWLCSLRGLSALLCRLTAAGAPAGRAGSRPGWLEGPASYTCCRPAVGWSRLSAWLAVQPGCSSADLLGPT